MDIILKEIERLKKAQEISEDENYAQYELDVACGYDMACDDILSFLKPFAEVDKHPKNVLAPLKECEPGLRETIEEEKRLKLTKMRTCDKLEMEKHCRKTSNKRSQALPPFDVFNDGGGGK